MQTVMAFVTSMNLQGAPMKPRALSIRLLNLKTVPASTSVAVMDVLTRWRAIMTHRLRPIMGPVFTMNRIALSAWR